MVELYKEKARPTFLSLDGMFYDSKEEAIYKSKIHLVHKILKDWPASDRLVNINETNSFITINYDKLHEFIREHLNEPLS